MTQVLIVVDEDTIIQKSCQKSAEEINREIELGVFEMPCKLQNPVVTQACGCVLVCERENRPELSKLQYNILDLMASGASQMEIAQVMNRSVNGIRYHVEVLKKKFGVSTREELIAIFCRLYLR